MAFGDFTVDRNSTKYVLGSGGTIVSYPTDEPAFEFNADGSYKGLLVEPAATNLFTYSEDFRNTADAGETRPWVYDNTTITADAETSPDGTVTADELEATASASVSYVSSVQTVSVATYTISIFAKASSSSVFWLYVRSSAEQGTAYFDLSDGSTQAVAGSAETPYNLEIRDVGNGWFRCSATFDNTTSASTGSGFGVCDAKGSLSVTAGKSLYFWGAQVETGPIATSYIPTTTASVTRVKDDITLGSASSLIGQTEGTLYVEVDWRLATGTTQFLLEASDGTANNRLLIYNGSSPVHINMYAKANNVTLTNQGESSTGYSGIQKIAFAYKTDDFELYRNGSSISSDTTGSLAALATLTDIDLGQTFGAINQANMWIRAVALYPKRLSDAECEALTTL